MNHIVKAVRKLRPESEFVISGDDLENIEWHSLTGEIPTKTEILEALAIVEQEENDAVATKIAAKASAIAKLAALGLTEDEAKAIIG